ncbi:hypothetical protein HPB49_006767 [Dermacentor silvarum]|uniref:Uncharacterized protein n=3 Tax=Dermacentor silvarum TaxID=543639 RepID=A0ACB8DWX2_DERSI|nr:hypothetical protein HPB49_006767 [Dermacentor silvarum]
MADETPTSDPTSTPTPIELDEPEGEWTTPGNVRKPRLAARPSFDLHAVCVHLPALPSATSAQLLDILPAFIRAAKLPAHTCADVSVHLRNRNRLAILKTHHIELASRLLSVESIVLAGRIYAVAPYLAAPTNSCRGVIHGIAPDATQEELLRDLDSYQADILLARRMGNTNSALITFAGMHVPFSVYYQRLEFRCRPHKPRAHHCTICLQYEHRTCACPGNQRLCPTCSTPISQPDEPHSCSPWCLHCQGHHTPFAEICPVRMQRDEACANAAKKQRLLHRQQWKSLNTSQPPVKPSSPSSIPKVRASSSLLPTHAQWGGGGQHPRLTQVSPTPVIQPAPSAQPKPAEYQTPAPVKQDSPLQKPVHQLELGLTELTSRVTALTSLVEMQQKRIEAQDQRTSNLETLISNLTQSLDNLNSTINKAFNDAPGPMEDKNHPFKRTHPIPAASVGLAPKIKPATLLAPPNPSNNKHHGDHNNSVELPNGSLRKPHYLTLSYYKKQGIPKTSQATELCTPTPPRRFQESTPNYDVWVDSLRRTRSQTTTTTEANPPSDHADPHLMRLWRRRKRLLSRIRTQPNNIQLRHTLDILNTDILTHCSILETTNWNRICDSINSSLHNKSAWLILRSLLGPQPAPLPTIQKHLSEHGHGYIHPSSTSLYPEYTGPSNSGLDSPFTLPDLERALAQNKTGTTPGVKFTHLSLWTCARPSIPYFMTLSSPPSKTPAVDPDSTVTFLLFSALDKLSSDSGPRCPRPSRSPAEHLKVEFTLQSGLNLISEFLSRSGMQAAPEKSELLLLSATKYQRSVNPLLNLTLAGTPIPRTSSCRVLGFPLQDHSFSRAIQSTITTCHQVTHLVRRVVRRRGELLCLHRDRQLGRLSSSAQGHWLLQRAGIRPIDFPLYTPQRPLPSNLRCAPIPSNMTPHLHEGRRQARAHFHDPFPPDTVTCYVDAAYYQTHGSTACVTMPTPLGIPITSTAGPFSLPTSSLSLELAAIVHATHELTLLPPSPRYRICSDSMAAIRALRDNRLPDNLNLHDDLSDALSLLSPALVSVVWVPGHAGIIGNKLAHELAREINSRAPTIPWPCPPTADEAHFYKKTLKQHYKPLRHSLQTLPPPHPRLSTAQVRTLRAIQLNTLITPARLYLYRYRSDPSCPNCPSTYANPYNPLTTLTSHWRVWLASAAFADQLAMVLLAEEYL